LVYKIEGVNVTLKQTLGEVNSIYPLSNQIIKLRVKYIFDPYKYTNFSF